MKISLQAVRKIRKKLENNGVIMSYSASINYESVGIHVFAIALLNVTSEAWDKYGKKMDDFLKHDNVVRYYRIPRGNVTHVMTYGFRDLSELNNFFKKIQEDQSRYIQINHLYIFPTDSIGRKSSHALIRKMLNEHGNEKSPLPTQLK